METNNRAGYSYEIVIGKLQDIIYKIERSHPQKENTQRSICINLIQPLACCKNEKELEALFMSKANHDLLTHVLHLKEEQNLSFELIRNTLFHNDKSSWKITAKL